MLSYRMGNILESFLLPKFYNIGYFIFHIDCTFAYDFTFQTSRTLLSENILIDISLDIINTELCLASSAFPFLPSMAIKAKIFGMIQNQIARLIHAQPPWTKNSHLFLFYERKESHQSITWISVHMFARSYTFNCIIYIL